MTAFSTTIAASADDAAESAGTVTIDGSALNCGATNQYLGFRFLNVTIPAASTINTATISVYFTSGSFDDPDVTIYANDVDDAATFSTASNNISSRALTTAAATWTASGVGVGVETSPDLAAVVQEVISRGGWASGNDLAIIFKGNSTNPMRLRALDAGGGDYATINIDYTAGGGGGPTQPPRSMHQFRQRGL